MANKMWEYKVVHLVSSADKLRGAPEFNTLGREGWNMVGFVAAGDYSGYYVAVF